MVGLNHDVCLPLYWTQRETAPLHAVVSECLVQAAVLENRGGGCGPGCDVFPTVPGHGNSASQVLGDLASVESTFPAVSSYWKAEKVRASLCLPLLLPPSPLLLPFLHLLLEAGSSVIRVDLGFA